MTVKPRRFYLPMVLRGVFFTVALVGGHSQAQCLRYDVQLVQPMTGCSLGEYSVPLAVSEQGDLVGYGACAGGNDRAVMAWGAGQVVPLNLTAGTSESRALAINSTGHIVGWMDPDGHRGFLWQNGRITDLGTLEIRGPIWTEALSINASGVVVGYSSVNSGSASHAFRWHNGEIFNLMIPQGPSNEARDINDRNQIVGWMGVYPVAHFAAEAFLWENGNVVTLPKPEGATNSTADAANNTGMICGHYSIADAQGPGGYKRRALAWNNGEIIDLGVLPGFLQSFAFDVNDDGAIVGYCHNPPSLGQNSRGFIWRHGVMIALNSVLEPDSPEVDVRRAVGINNSGQIAADAKIPGVSGRMARLTPLPPRAGDTNCDWLVNINDLLNIIGAWGPNAPPPIFGSGSADLDGSGTVDIDDLLLVISDWG